MVATAAAFEPPRSAFAPSPQPGHGGRGHPRRRSPRDSRRAVWNGKGPNRGPRPLRAALARICIVAVAAALLLVGPLLSEALALDVRHDGDVGRQTAVVVKNGSEIPIGRLAAAALRQATTAVAANVGSGLSPTEAFLPK